MTIQIQLKDVFSPYEIAKELANFSNAIHNEIARGTVIQIRQGSKVELYFMDIGKRIYP